MEVSLAFERLMALANRYRVLFFAVTLAAPSVAHAAPVAEQAPAFSIGSKPLWYLMGGATFGGTTIAQERGWYVGGEASVVRLSRGGRYVGLYGDGYYDFGAHRTYATLGPEFGYKFVGLDVAAAARMGGDHIEWGPAGRVFVTVGVLSLYGRYAYFVESLGSDNEHVVQLGASMKLPLAVWGLR